MIKKAKIIGISFSGEFREEEEKFKIKQTAEKLEKKIQKERFKILDPWWTTGKESSNILKYMAEYYGWNEQQVNNFNNFISMVATVESDNDWHCLGQYSDNIIDFGDIEDLSIDDSQTYMNTNFGYLYRHPYH